MTNTAASDPIQIDVWSDIACPWCYIGKRNLEAGVAGSEVPVNVTFHSFELSPDTPLDFEGTTIDYLADRKGMPRDQVQQMLDHVTNVAKNAGLEYHFDKVKQTNTVKAHELLHFAKAHGKQAEMKERLMAANFTEGLNLASIDQLVQLAGDVGLDADAARSALENDEFLPAVRADQAQAREYGIQGVPFFVINNKYAISGAQPAEAFAQALARVAAED